MKNEYKGSYKGFDIMEQTTTVNREFKAVGWDCVTNTAKVYFSAQSQAKLERKIDNYEDK